MKCPWPPIQKNTRPQAIPSVSLTDSGTYCIIGLAPTRRRAILRPILTRPRRLALFSRRNPVQIGEHQGEGENYGVSETFHRHPEPLLCGK